MTSERLGLTKTLPPPDGGVLWLLVLELLSAGSNGRRWCLSIDLNASCAPEVFFVLVSWMAVFQPTHSGGGQ
jgi:hypothetical protein